MRTLIASVLLAGLALPALAAESPRTRAADLFSDVQAERLRLEGESSKDARVALKFMKKGEKALGKLVKRYDKDPALDHKKMALFAKAGQWIERARTTGAVADTSAPVLGWAEAYDAWMADVDELVDDAVTERDRLLDEKFRTKVTRRLERGLAYYHDAANEGVALDRVRAMVRAVQQLRAAYQKAQKLCMKETMPNCPAGVVAQNHYLSYRGRHSLTVFDMEWRITLHTREGVFVAVRQGALTDPGRVLDRPLPWTVVRGETIDALSVIGIPLGFGHRMDGSLIWHTSAGEFEVPVHVDQ